MKAKELNELRGKSLRELEVDLNTARRDQFKLRLHKAGGEMTKTHRIKEKRREIAQLNTIISAKRAEETKEGSK